ncbi:ABC transporter permease [Candidatus Parvarchaeota archaeon]|nr:ABC transporter permease [Candidatus Parvarchaeota archaeon]
MAAKEKVRFPSFLRTIVSLSNRDLKKWYLNPALLVISLIQPIIWLTLFGKAFNLGSLFAGNAGSAILTRIFGTSSYFSFLAIGMLAFITVSTSMMGGMSIVWDRRFGFIDKILSTPVSRAAIIIGKIANSIVRALIQAGVVLIIAVALGMTVSYITLSGLITTFGALFLLSFGMSSLFILLALRSRDWQSQMMIINLLMLPLLFASNAFFPVAEMPSWLQAIANVNPISYAISIGRNAMLGIPTSSSIYLQMGYLGAFAVGMGIISIVLSWKLLKG